MEYVYLQEEVRNTDTTKDYDEEGVKTLREKDNSEQKYILVNKNGEEQPDVYKRQDLLPVAVPETFVAASYSGHSAGFWNLRSTDSCLWQPDYYSCFFAYGMCNPQFCYSRI